MRTLRRHTAAVATAAILPLALAACGGDADTGDTGDGTEEMTDEMNEDMTDEEMDDMSEEDMTDDMTESEG